MMMQRTAIRATPIGTPFGSRAVTVSFCAFTRIAG
jgi:hypothetical protein